MNGNNIQYLVIDFDTVKLREYFKDYHEDLQSSANIRYRNNRAKPVDISSLRKMMESMNISTKIIDYFELNDSEAFLEEMSKYYSTKNRNYDITSELMVLRDKLLLESERLIYDSDVERWTNAKYDESLINIEFVPRIIELAMNSIPNWNQFVHLSIPLPIKNEGEVISSVEVAVSHRIKSKMAPSFILFINPESKEYTIDDILDAGDTDFFDSLEIETAYFQLVDKLFNKDQKNKILTLYTARPKSDRQSFLSSNDMPARIFLTNSLSRAEGYLIDLAGREGRDIYVIRIESKYLLKTLDDGVVREYQIMPVGHSDRVPVKSINLF